MASHTDRNPIEPENNPKAVCTEQKLGSVQRGTNCHVYIGILSEIPRKIRHILSSIFEQLPAVRWRGWPVGKLHRLMRRHWRTHRLTARTAHRYCCSHCTVWLPGNWYLAPGHTPSALLKPQKIFGRNNRSGHLCSGSEVMHVPPSECSP